MSGNNGPGYTPADALAILPVARKRVQHGDLTASAATQDIAFDAALPNTLFKAYAYVDIGTAWSLQANATQLTLQMGDSGTVNGLLAAGNLIGTAAGLSALGGAGSEYGDGLVFHNDYTPRGRFTASGGTTPLVSEADEGDLIMAVPFICIPADLYAYTGMT